MVQVQPVVGQITRFFPPTNEMDSTATLEPSMAYETDFDLGISKIEESDGAREQYIATAIMPEFYYGPFSAGLMLRAHIDTRSGGFRPEDYDSPGDFLSILRFAQYSERGDPVRYGRLGELEDATLGYGHFINRFSNSIRLDDQKRGFEVAGRIGAFRLEALYSNLLAAEVYGLRGSTRPFAAHPDPVLASLDVGISFAGDFSREGSLVNPDFAGFPFLTDPTLQQPGVLQTAIGDPVARVGMIGIDVGLPLFNTERRSGLAYFELGKIYKYGMGAATGMLNRWELSNEINLETQLEFRLLGPNYLPSYFNSLYEVERFRQVNIEDAAGNSVQAINTKQNLLDIYPKSRVGSYTSMSWKYKRIFYLTWSYEYTWNQGNDGWMHLDTRLKSRDLPIYFRLTFDRVSPIPIRDAASVGKRITMFRFEGAYQFFEFLMLGFGIRHSFEPTYKLGVPTGLSQRKRIEPRFRFVLPV